MPLFPRASIAQSADKRELETIGLLLQSNNPTERRNAMLMIRERGLPDFSEELFQIWKSASNPIPVRNEAALTLLMTAPDEYVEKMTRLIRRYLSRRKHPLQLPACPSCNAMEAADSAGRRLDSRTEIFTIAHYHLSPVSDQAAEYERLLGMNHPFVHFAVLESLRESSLSPAQKSRLALMAIDSGVPAVAWSAWRLCASSMPAEEYVPLLGSRLDRLCSSDPCILDAALSFPGGIAYVDLLPLLRRKAHEASRNTTTTVYADLLENKCRELGGWVMLRRLLDYAPSAGAGALVIACLLLYILKRKRDRKEYERAMELMRQAEYPKAAKLLGHISHSSSCMRGKALLHYVRALLRSGLKEEAREVMEELDPSRYRRDELMLLGADLAGKKMKDEAARIYEHLISRDAFDAEAKCALQRVLKGETVSYGGASSPEDTADESLHDIVRKMYDGKAGEIRLIGKGGMGAVFSVELPGAGVVAIKVLSPNLALREEIRKRFYREAVAISNLSHPNICKIQKVLKGKLPAYQMEYLGGKSLKTLVEAGKRFSVREGALIAIKVTDAIAFAHSKRIIHRDIKPDNIIIMEGNEPKLLDFGLAKFHQAYSSDSITQTGEMMGTPMYMSPEQLAGNDVGPASDIYSLGLTFFYMFSGGEYPLPRDLYARIQAAPSHLAEFVEVPGELDELVMSMLENDPSRRPTAEEVLQRLKALKNVL